MNIKKFLISLVILTVSISVQAGSHSNCKILKVNQGSTNTLLVTLDCNDETIASCASANKNMVGFDPTTEIGKIRTSMVLSAFAADKTVTFSTYGACTSGVPTVAQYYSLTVQ